MTNHATDVPAAPVDASEADQQTAPEAKLSPKDAPWLFIGERFGLLLILVAVVVLFSALRPDTFATVANWQTIVSTQSVTLIVALALMVPLLAGSFDLSIGSVAALSAMVAAGMMARDHMSLLPACLIALAIGLVVGFINGTMVSRFGLDGLIATLGSATVLDSLVQWYSNSNSIATGISQHLVDFGTRQLLGIPWLVVVAAAIACLVGYVVTQTPFGRRLTSIGSSGEAARLVGIRVDRMVLLSYMISGGLAAVAGVLLLAQQGSASPATGGISILLPALAAVFLGASTWNPGQFNVIGTVLGLLLVATLVSGLTLMGVAPWVGGASYGGSLILAVGAAAWFRRRRRGN